MPDLVPTSSAPLALPDVEILAGQLAPSSQRMYRRDVAAYLAWCAERGLPGAEASSLARWRQHLAAETTKSPLTINRMLAAVKRLMKEAAAQGYLDATAAARFAGVGGVRALSMKGRLRQNNKTLITPADMRRLCDSPDATPRGLRDRALLHTLASSGVRVSEAVSLRSDAIHVVGEGQYLITVCGKTDVEPRQAPLSAEAYTHIQTWLRARGDLVSPYVFTGTRGRGARQVATPLSAAAAWLIVQGAATACGIAHVKPHDFRRFAVTQLVATAGIRAAQLAAGHKSIQTTTRYDLNPLQAGLTDKLF